jgi:hypothetical protein
MTSVRPLGVTLIAFFIIIVYSLILIVGLSMLIFGIQSVPYIGAEGVLVGFIGLVLLVWAFLRISVGFGLLSMSGKAWKSAMMIFGIGLIIDLVFTPGQVLLDIIVLVYLLIVKRHFVF